MTVKTFEVRDKGTFTATLAVRLDPGNDKERFLLSQSGYGKDAETQAEYILFGRLDASELRHDSMSWGNRTMFTAHKFVRENFDKLESGAVIDVEFILGESLAPKKSEQENEEN